MPKKLLIPSAICILAIALVLALLSPKKNDRSSSSGSSTLPADAPTDSRNPGETDAGTKLRTKHERANSDEAQALREMEKEFDKLLPAKFPGQFSSLCDATLNPGETLVLCGFMTADGNYEFTTLEAKPIKADGTPLEPGEAKDSPSQYMVKTRSVIMSPEASSELGLGSLMSPARTRIQKSVVLPQGEVLLRPDKTVGVMTSPSVTLRPGTAVSISAGTEEKALVISMIVNPGDTKGSIRIRTRIESPVGE
jgi:hypothetical protein